MITFDYIGGRSVQEIIRSYYKGEGVIKILHNDINCSPTILILNLNKGSSLQKICCNEEWVPTKSK